MPTRLCLTPRCPNPATYRGRCSTCSPARERATHPNRHIYNTKRWQLLRRRILFNQSLCGCGAIAIDVDHITAIEDGGDPWAPANLQPMCQPCHAAKTNAEVRAR